MDKIAKLQLTKIIIQSICVCQWKKSHIYEWWVQVEKESKQLHELLDIQELFFERYRDSII